MKKQAKLAFDRLEEEMEMIPEEELENYLGGSGSGFPPSTGGSCTLVSFEGVTTTGNFGGDSGGYGGGSTGVPGSGFQDGPPGEENDPFVYDFGQGSMTFSPIGESGTGDSGGGNDENNGVIVQTVQNIFDVGGASADFFENVKSNASKDGSGEYTIMKNHKKIGTMVESPGGGVELDTDGSVDININGSPVPTPFSVSVGRDAEGRTTFGVSIGTQNASVGIEGSIDTQKVKSIVQKIEHTAAFSMAAQALESMAEYGSELAF